MPLMRGAILSPRHVLAAATPHVSALVIPSRFFRLAKTPLPFFGNDRYGCCVTSEEFSAKAADGRVGTDAEAIATARKWHGLNGADLSTILDYAASGFTVNGQTVQDGDKQSVDYTNYDSLCAAIFQGQVKIASGSNGFESAGAGKNKPWVLPSARIEGIDHCFTGDTKVSLLDGREVSVSDLASGVAGESFWVYSCDKDGQVVAGKAHSARKTRSNASLVKVTLDSGECIRCTEDHRFMMRDGSYTPAAQLKCGDSLMPLYRKLSKKGYEVYYNPNNRRFNATHRMAAFGPSCRGFGMVAHHVDFNKRNNSPDNLRAMTPSDHAAQRKATIAAAAKPVTDKQREARRDNARRLNARKMVCDNNHKVVSVEPCGQEDVYDITVDKHHNFALSAGVFVHNCTGLAGYGTFADCCKAIGYTASVGIGDATPSVVLETWGSYGVVPYTASLLPMMDSTPGRGNSEAWLRVPTTVVDAPVGPPDPGPAPLPDPLLAVGPSMVKGPCPYYGCYDASGNPMWDDVKYPPERRLR